VSPAQEPAALERRYQRLLRSYPPSHRAAHREEMLGVLLATARPGQRMPGASQTVNLVTCGLAIRARRALTAGLWRDALAVVSLIGPVVMLVLAALNVAETVREEVRFDHIFPPGLPFWRLDLVPDLGGPVVVMIGWLAVVYLALTGRRQAAAAVASVPLALALVDLLVTVMHQTGAWLGGVPLFFVTAGEGSVFLASLTACSLAFSAGPRRGLAIAGRRRACLMIVGLSVIVGWLSVVLLLNPAVPLSDSVYRLLDVLTFAAVIVVSSPRDTAGSRVAALIAAGLLPGLVSTLTFLVAGDQTAEVVLVLGLLLATVLVWPLAITSWKGQARRDQAARGSIPAAGC
jgi:hypothetical protein